MEKWYRVRDEVVALPSFLAVPSMGVIPVNAFALKAKEPVLVDAGHDLSRQIPQCRVGDELDESLGLRRHGSPRASYLEKPAACAPAMRPKTAPRMRPVPPG